MMKRVSMLICCCVLIPIVVFSQTRTGSGIAVFFDSTAYSDAFGVTMSSVSAPLSGKAYFAWLGADNDVQYLKLGQITVQGNGSVSFTYKPGGNNNLAALYKKFLISEEITSFSGSVPTVGSVVFADSLHGPGLPTPTSSLARIRNCIASFSNTAQNLGLAEWMMMQSDGIIMHAGFSRDDAQNNNVAGARTHADHVYDFIRGKLSGLVPGNSSVATNGDPLGYGFRRYGDIGTHDSSQGGAGFLGGAGYYVNLVINDPSATPHMKSEGASALIALRNAFGSSNDSGWAKEVVDRSLSIMNGVYPTGNLQTEGVPFYNLALKFINGTVGAADTASATGGVIQAHRHIQRMAGFILSGPVIPSSVERLTEEPIPEHFGLRPNYPNPFNGATRISFELPVESLVRVTIYNILGQEVARLIEGRPMGPGVYSVSWDSGNSVSGTYLCELTAERDGKTQTEVRQMVLVK